MKTNYENINLADRLGRRFEKLRISLTNQCNLACTYCMPHNSPFYSFKFKSKQYLPLESDTGKPIQFSRLQELTRMLLEVLSIKSVKLTGGEPLISPAVIPMIKLLHNLGIKNLSMTTNGVFLSGRALSLKKNGLQSVNISLDAIHSEVFRKVTGRNSLKQVLNGIEKALEVGLKVKINAVILKGINDSEIIPLLEYFGKKGVIIRFLELMEMGAFFGNKKEFLLTQHEILEKVKEDTSIARIMREPSATASYWDTDKGYRFGIIANHSAPFCVDCNRLRLDSSGRLYGCITDEKGISTESVKEKSDLLPVLIEAMSRKQAKRFNGSPRTMISLGG